MEKPSSPSSLPQNLFQQIVETANTGVWLIDLQGITLYVNQCLAQMMGYSVQELVGRSFYDFMSAPSRKLAGENLKRREDGVSENHDFCFLRKDGSELWTLVSTNPFYGEGGSIQGALAHVIDISERKKLEVDQSDDLLQSRSFLNSLIENLPISVFVKDAVHLRFVELNRACEEMTGYSRKELLGKNDYDLFPREQAEFFRKKDREVLNGRAVVEIADEKIQSTDRGNRILRTKKIPLFSKNGAPEYLIGISEDITDFRRAEEDRLRLLSEEVSVRERNRSRERDAFLLEAGKALTSSLNYHESLNRLSRLIVPEFCDWSTISILKNDDSIERVVTYHPDPKKKPLLEQLLKMLPVSGRDGFSHLFANRTSHVSSPLNLDALKKVCSGPEHVRLLLEIGIKHFMIVPILAHGKILGAISFFSNRAALAYDSGTQSLGEELGRRVGASVENALLYEAARKAIVVRDEFLSIASHELKTPITSLRLQLQLAQKQLRPDLNQIPSPERLSKTFKVSIDQVDRLTHLIEDLLDVTRIQAGRVSFNLARVNLTLLAKEVLERYAEPLQSVQCTVDLQIAENVWVLADAERVEQVLVNLLGNAIKYAPGTQVTISVKVPAQSMLAELSVADQGPGVPLDLQEDIFERFGRASPSRNISGLGLGLYISKEIIVALGGQMKVESEPGKGSRFVATLPLASFEQS
jgi:PAS domain S-box-containing protein